MVTKTIGSVAYVLGVSKQQIISSIWKIFYNRIVYGGQVSDPYSRSKFVYPAWPDVDINNAQSYPIMIINSPDINITNFTYEKKKVHARVQIEISSTNQKQLDDLSDEVVYCIECVDQSLMSANITFLKLTDTSSDHVIRDKITVHKKMLQYELDYTYGAGI